LLLQHLGLSKALDFLMRKRIVSAQEALELGLVSRSGPSRRARRATMALARSWPTAAGGDAPAQRSLYNATAQTFEQAGDDIAGKTAISDHHPDTKEGMPRSARSGRRTSTAGSTTRPG